MLRTYNRHLDMTRTPQPRRVRYTECEHECPLCSQLSVTLARFTDADRIAIVEEALQEENVSKVARKYGLSVRLLFAWQARYLDPRKPLSAEEHKILRGRHVMVRQISRATICDDCCKPIATRERAVVMKVPVGSRAFHYDCVANELKPVKLT